MTLTDNEKMQHATSLFRY